MIEECFELFKKYCKQELDPYMCIHFYDDESGDIVNDAGDYVLGFDTFQDCIDQLKQKLK
jgi:hypothetical protein